MGENLFGTFEQTAQILIRDNREVYNTVTNPAIVYDIESGLLKIGEKEAMQDYFTLVTTKFREGGAIWLADLIRLAELPKNQELIDKIFGTHDYICRLHREYNLP